MVSNFGFRLAGLTLLGAAALTTLTIGAASVARADGWDGERGEHRAYGRDRDGDRDAWRWRAERREGWREHRPYGYGYGYYAPPPVYYYPQPRVYYAPQPTYYPGSFNITIPIR